MAAVAEMAARAAKASGTSELEKSKKKKVLDDDLWIEKVTG